jgi:hypothetical protein
MNPTEWAAFVLACLSIAAIIIGGLRYIVTHEVPPMLSQYEQRLSKLETMVLELLTHERKKTIKKRTR